MKLHTKIVLGVLAIIIISFGTLSFMLFSNSKYELTAEPSVEAFDSIMDARAQGKTIELKDEDINSIFSMLLKKEITKGGLTIYGIEAKVKASQITFSLPASFKGFKMLISTSGTLMDNGSDIIYKPNYIRAGSVKLPLKLLMSKMKDIKTSTLKINEDTISLDKNALPLKIGSMRIVEDHMELSFNKNSLVQGESSSGNQGSTENNSNSGSNLSSGNSGSSKTQTNTQPVTKVEIPANQGALKELSSQLSSAISIASGSKEKDILSRIKTSVDKKIANPKYNIYNEAAAVKASYKALAVTERKHIRSIILSTVDIQNAMELSEIFGL